MTLSVTYSQTCLLYSQITAYQGQFNFHHLANSAMVKCQDMVFSANFNTI